MQSNKKREYKRWQTAGGMLMTITLASLLVLISGQAGGPASAALGAVPSISITSPANGTTLPAPASLTLEAKPGPGSSTIVEVAFFNCTTSLGTDTSAPYTREVANLGAGTYTFVARATDSGGMSALSEPITVTVTGPLAPTVMLVTPVSNRIYEAPASIELTAEAAANSGGSITRVEFLNGSTILGRDTDAPYSFTWSDVAANREYQLRARVITSNGATVTSASSFVTVTPPASTIQIKETAYPIPTDGTARFVDGEDTGDGQIGDDATGDGSSERPWRTIGKAFTTAPVGSTIIIRAGTYRGAGNRGGVTKRLTLQPYPGERVWIKGSEVVTDWQWDAEQELWYKDWPYEFRPPANESDANFVDYARNPLASLRDMVFIDGRPLTQVARFEACDISFTPADCTGGVVKEGTFCLDYGANKTSAGDNRLYIKDDPTVSTVEATRYRDGLNFNRNASAASDASGSVIRGLGFAHHAGTALLASALRVQIEDNTFVWNAAQGLAVSGIGDAAQANTTYNPNAVRNYLVVRGNTFSYNGLRGLGGGRAHNLVLENNLINYNNIERFRITWAAAGVKLISADDQIIRHNVLEDNLATALWLDISVTDATVVQNIARRNMSIGLFLEISSRAVIAFNLAVENGAGIQISDSSAARLYNNTLVNNNRNIVVTDSNRVNNTNSNRAIADAEVAAGIEWEARNITIKNNIMSNARSSDMMVDVVDNTCGNVGFPCNDIERIISELDYNAYYRTDATQPTNLLRWKPIGRGSDRRFTALELFHSATGFEENGLESSGAINPFFADVATGDYRLQAESPAIGAGEPLPEDVAATVGIEPGVSISLGAVHEELPRPGIRQ